MGSDHGRTTDDGFVGGPLDLDQWDEFLRGRGVDGAVRAEPVAGGWVNANYRLDGDNGAWFLRRYRLTAPADVDTELRYVSAVADAGFPTPGPIAGHDGWLWATVLGLPAALFPWVEGRHPRRTGPFTAEEVELGPVLAALTGRLHNIETGLSLRTSDDPPARVRNYIDRVEASATLAQLAGMDEVLAGMTAALAEWKAATADVELPLGPIHWDMHPGNILVGEDGAVIAILDFDDAHQAPLLFDPLSLLFPWCRAPSAHLDLDLVRDLLGAYDAVRPMSTAEWRSLAAGLIVDRGAEATGYLTAVEPSLLSGAAAVESCGTGREMLELLSDGAWRSACIPDPDRAERERG